MSTCDTHVTESGTLAFRVALSVLRHREDAEDVAQEAVVRSLQRFDSLKDQTRFRAWLVRITWRLALDRRRSDTRRAARDFRSIQSSDSERSAEHQALQRERTDQLWAAIDQLPARLRLPLVLGTLQGRTVEEVSSLIGVPAGTVKSRMFEARRQLKRALIGTGVFVALSGVLLSLIPVPRVRDTQLPAVASRVAIVAPEAASRPAVVVRGASRPVPPPDAQPWKPSPSQIPIVSVSTVAVKTVEVPVVVIPLVRIPVVDIKSVQVPTMKTVVVAAPDAYQEK